MTPQPLLRLQKACQFQGPRMNALDMASCCSERKITKCGNTLPLHCQILKRANVQLFQRRKQNLYTSYSQFRKLHVCTLFFLYLVFGRKIRAINYIVILSEAVCLRPYPPQFLKNGHVPPFGCIFMYKLLR